jgi:branched-chain amino acid transport system permease protein
MSKQSHFNLFGYGIFIICLAVIPLFTQDPYFLHILILAGIYLILTSSVRLAAIGGMMSLTHVAFMGIGAYASAIIVMRLGFSTWSAMLLAGLIPAVFALFVGFPFVRVRGVYFSLMTLFFAEVIRMVLTEWRELTGPNVLYNIPTLDAIKLGVINISFESKTSYYYIVLIITVIVLVFLYFIEKSRVGLRLRAIQEADYVAESIGIDINSLKVIVLAIGAFCCGIAGSLYGHYLSILTPNNFNLFFSLYLLIYMVVGGRKYFVGPIIGVLCLTILPEVLRVAKELQPIIFAVLLLLTLFLEPGGIAELLNKLRFYLKQSPRKVVDVKDT